MTKRNCIFFPLLGRFLRPLPHRLLLHPRVLPRPPPHPSADPVHDPGPSGPARLPRVLHRRRQGTREDGQILRAGAAAAAGE